MANRIEDYAVIGNCRSMALVGCDGSIDWMCMPRFDSAACFAALLGGPEHGRWLIAPEKEGLSTRQYRGDTLILETTFETEDGAAVVIDFMNRRDGVSDVVRIVRGLSGTVRMRTELVVRYEYGSVVPWVNKGDDDRLQLTAGPDRMLLDTKVELRGEDMKTVGEFEVSEGEEVTFALNWSLSYTPMPESADPATLLKRTEEFWEEWVGGMKPLGEWSSVVTRSLLVLKA